MAPYTVRSTIAHVNQVFQAVLIAHESVTNRAKRTENKLWKRVVPSVTEFAWLPPSIAWAFCGDCFTPATGLSVFLPSMNRTSDWRDGPSKRAYLLRTRCFLGTQEVAEELAVYTNMAPERLCLGCGAQGWKKSSHPSPLGSEVDCLRLRYYSNLPCVLLAHRPLKQS